MKILSSRCIPRDIFSNDNFKKKQLYLYIFFFIALEIENDLGGNVHRFPIIPRGNIENP